MTDDQLNYLPRTVVVDHIAESDGPYQNEGDAIGAARTQHQDESVGTVSVEINLTRLFKAGPRTSNKLELLKIEAQHAADGKRGNFARPTRDDIETRLREWCDDNDLEPAWEAGDDIVKGDEVGGGE